MKVKKTRTPKFKPFKRAQNPSKSYDYWPHNTICYLFDKVRYIFQIYIYIYIYQLPKNYNIQLYIILII